jgi:hypothetical protein
MLAYGMSTVTQFNPQADLNEQLKANGISKTVYALVTRETRWIKSLALGHGTAAERDEYFDMFEDAWTSKQDSAHQEFFDAWHRWSAPVVDLDRGKYRYFYPTAGASQAIQHLIYDLKARGEDNCLHIFEGEYEGYKAMAEAAGLRIQEHKRDEWRYMLDEESDDHVIGGDLFFISQPSAIDGNVWPEFNDFVNSMPEDRIVVDVTYVGAVPQSAVPDRFNLNAPSIRNVVFSLSKPFGVYYDRIGGVWCREEDDGLFGLKWFKNLTSLRIGTLLMQNMNVFYIPERYAPEQNLICNTASNFLRVRLRPSDVFILATGEVDPEQRVDMRMVDYLTRAGKLRVCLSPGIKQQLRANERSAARGGCL